MNVINFVIIALKHHRLLLMRQLLGTVIFAIKIQIYIVGQFTPANLWDHYHQTRFYTTYLEYTL